MKSSKSSPSLFEIPNIKDAKVVKTEIKPFLHNIVYNYTQSLPIENEPYKKLPQPKHREEQLTQLISKATLKMFSMLS